MRQKQPVEMRNLFRKGTGRSRLPLSSSFPIGRNSSPQNETIPLSVLHPLHCVESKTVNLATIPQDAGNRQDLKHLRLSLASLRQYITTITLDGGSEQLLLRWAHRIRMNSNHELGLLAAIRYGISFQEAIPSDIWQTLPGPLADFVRKEWQDWKDETNEKTTDLRDLDTWLKSLNLGNPRKATDDKK